MFGCPSPYRELFEGRVRLHHLAIVDVQLLHPRQRPTEKQNGYIGDNSAYDHMVHAEVTAFAAPI